MISLKTRLRQLIAQKKASLRVLSTMGKLIEAELKRGSHLLFTADDVTHVLSLLGELDEKATALCAAVGFNPEVDEEAAIVALLGSADGEKMARRVVELGKQVDEAVLRWEHKHLEREKYECADATPLVVRNRMLSFQYGAFLRQAEAAENLISALIAQHSLQFWVWDGKFQFAGQPEEAKQ